MDHFYHFFPDKILLSTISFLFCFLVLRRCLSKILKKKVSCFFFVYFHFWERHMPFLFSFSYTNYISVAYAPFMPFFLKKRTHNLSTSFFFLEVLRFIYSISLNLKYVISIFSYISIYGHLIFRIQFCRFVLKKLIIVLKKSTKKQKTNDTDVIN